MRGTCPAADRARGGELAADERWLDGYHGDIEGYTSLRDFVGDVTQDTFFGDPTVEYPRGDPAVEAVFGVAFGVSQGLIESFCPIGLGAVSDGPLTKFVEETLLTDLASFKDDEISDCSQGAISTISV